MIRLSWLQRAPKMPQSSQVPRDPEVQKQKHEAAVQLQTHHRLYKEIAAIQKELERQRRETKGI